MRAKSKNEEAFLDGWGHNRYRTVPYNGTLFVRPSIVSASRKFLVAASASDSMHCLLTVKIYHLYLKP